MCDGNASRASRWLLPLNSVPRAFSVNAVQLQSEETPNEFRWIRTNLLSTGTGTVCRGGVFDRFHFSRENAQSVDIVVREIDLHQPAMEKSRVLSLLNITSFVVHNLLILFNMTGWIWPRTRKLHLVTLGATLFSWIVMGAWYGWGYCLCADWHFQIRRQLGIHDHESSYMELLLNRIPGVTVTRRFADVVTVSGLVLILMATTWVWIRHFSVGRGRPGQPEPLCEDPQEPLPDELYPNSPPSTPGS